MRIIDEYAAVVVDYFAIVAVAESVELIVDVLMQAFGVVVAAAVGWDFGMQYSLKLVFDCRTRLLLWILLYHLVMTRYSMIMLLSIAQDGGTIFH